MQKKSREAANNDNNNKRDNTTNTKIFECYRLSICLTILLLPSLQVIQVLSPLHFYVRDICINVCSRYFNYNIIQTSKI